MDCGAISLGKFWLSSSMIAVLTFMNRADGVALRTSFGYPGLPYLDGAVSSIAETVACGSEF